jgi:hypothetical protein
MVAGATQEKATRAALKSAVERSISKRTTVILDSLNSIKVRASGAWSPSVCAFVRAASVPCVRARRHRRCAAHPHCPAPRARNSLQHAHPAATAHAHAQGYRYELWCAARAAGTRFCMVHVAAPLDACRAWNEARPAQQRYADAV